jgi:hypothetical protein
LYETAKAKSERHQLEEKYKALEIELSLVQDDNNNYKNMEQSLLQQDLVSIVFKPMENAVQSSL